MKFALALTLFAVVIATCTAAPQPNIGEWFQSGVQAVQNAAQKVVKSASEKWQSWRDNLESYERRAYNHMHDVLLVTALTIEMATNVVKEIGKEAQNYASTLQAKAEELKNQIAAGLASHKETIAKITANLKLEAEKLEQKTEEAAVEFQETVAALEQTADADAQQVIENTSADIASAKVFTADVQKDAQEVLASLKTSFQEKQVEAKKIVEEVKKIAQQVMAGTLQDSKTAVSKLAETLKTKANEFKIQAQKAQEVGSKKFSDFVQQFRAKASDVRSRISQAWSNLVNRFSKPAVPAIEAPVEAAPAPVEEPAAPVV